MKIHINNEVRCCMYIVLTDTQHVYKVGLRPKNELMYYLIKHALWTGLQFKYHFIYNSHHTREGNKEMSTDAQAFNDKSGQASTGERLRFVSQPRVSDIYEWQQFTWTKPESSWVWSMQFMSSVYLSSLKVRLGDLWPFMRRITKTGSCLHLLHKILIVSSCTALLGAWI